MNGYEARRLAGIVHRDPCGGLPRWEVERRCGLRGADLKAALFIAYRKGWVDFCGGYVVAARPEWRVTARSAQ